MPRRFYRQFQPLVEIVVIEIKGGNCTSDSTEGSERDLSFANVTCVTADQYTRS
jgi:hypothetical protein